MEKQPPRVFGKRQVRNYRPVGSLHRKILQNGRENGQKNTSVKIETRKLPPGRRDCILAWKNSFPKIHFENFEKIVILAKKIPRGPKNFPSFFPPKKNLIATQTNKVCSNKVVLCLAIICVLVTFSWTLTITVSICPRPL